jgi:acetylornithine/succinyldiaminopimelate/putrescine aminotransferase
MTRIDDILHGGFDQFRDFVNPLIALRAELSGEPTKITRTDGGRLVDTTGQLIEDFHGTQAFGHRNPEIAQAIREFLDSDSASWFPSRVNPFAGSLAQRLCERANKTGTSGPYSNAFFVSSGSEAVESGLKLSRAVTGRPRVLGLVGAYHGCTMGSCALMTDGPYRQPFAPHVPGIEHLRLDDIDGLAKALSTDDVAGIIVEPIQLEGGVRHLSPAYIDALCELTKQHGTLLIADEVQTGLGRTGRFLASETWPRRPDAVLLGKHLGGGLLPISAMLTRRELFEQAYGKNFESSEAHNSTFSGNAMVCVAAHAALDLLTDDLIARVAATGTAFRNGVREALQDLPLFDSVRGEGLVVGIALEPTDHPWLSFEHFGMGDLSHQSTIGLLLCHRLYKRGFFCFVCGHDWGVLRLQPRFQIDTETLATFTSVIRQELEYLCTLV